MLPHQTLVSTPTWLCGLPSNMNSSLHKTWQTSFLFLKSHQIQNLKRKKRGDMAYYVPPSEKVGGHVPHQIATMRANTQKKTWEIMVNPDVDGYAKTQNHWKIIRKTNKNNIRKRILKPKRKFGGGPVFTLSLPGGEVHPLSPVSYVISYECYSHTVSCPYSTALRYELVS